MTYKLPGTKPFAGPCPAGRDQSEPCPFKLKQAVGDNCNACLCEWNERAGIFQHDAGYPKAQAERMATEQLRDALARAEHRQGELFR